MGHAIRLRHVENERSSKCRDCGRPVKWATTEKNKKMPLELDAAISGSGDLLEVDGDHVHWAHCPKAKDRKATGKRSPKATKEVEQLEANQLAELARLRKDCADLRAIANKSVQPEIANQLRDEIAGLRSLLEEVVRRLDTETKEQVADWLERELKTPMPRKPDAASISMSGAGLDYDRRPRSYHGD